MIQDILIEEPQSFAPLRDSEIQLFILVIFPSNMLTYGAICYQFQSVCVDFLIQ